MLNIKDVSASLPSVAFDPYFLLTTLDIDTELSARSRSILGRREHGKDVVFQLSFKVSIFSKYIQFNFKITCKGKRKPF